MMQRIVSVAGRLSACLILLNLVSCTSSPTMRSPAPNEVTATITRLESRPSIRVDYRFDQPLTEFVFQEPARQIRGAYWMSKTPGVWLNNGVAKSTKPVQQMIFEIYPDRQRANHNDPGMYILDGGLVFDLDYLSGDKRHFITRIFVDASETTLITQRLDVALGTGLFEITDPIGFAYLGHSDSVTRATTVVVAELEFPDSFILGIDELFADSANYYRNLLGSNMPHPARAFLLLDQDKPLGFRGFVNENIIALHLEGEAWLNFEAGAITQLSRYVRHEIFHMFDGYHDEPSDQYRSAWLVEGAAEYFASQLDSLENNRTRTSIQALFDQCLSMLGSQPLIINGQGTAGRVPYICGEFLTSVLTLLLKDPQALASTWREMLQPNSLNGAAISTAELFDIVESKGAPRFRNIADLTLNTSGLARWQDISAQLIEAGIDISFSHFQAVQAEGTRLISQLLRKHCKGPRAFQGIDQRLILTTPNCGGGLRDRAEVAEIESYQVTDVEAWVNALVKRCNEADTIRFTLSNGEEMPVSCR